jgi:membrane protein implicated in regulation of membrane protease activity
MSELVGFAAFVAVLVLSVRRMLEERNNDHANDRTQAVSIGVRRGIIQL